MKIVIMGGSGFIGSDFIARYGEACELIYILRRKKSKCFSASNVIELHYEQYLDVEDVDLVINFAFDHTYRDNIWLADIAYKICSVQKSPLLYLSTFMVRDIFTEHSKYSGSKSKFYDPYTLEKIKVKNYLEVLFQKEKIPLIQVEPGIVFGIGGGWHEHILKAMSSKSLQLPNKGKKNGPFIYVGQLSTIIFKVAEQKILKNMTISATSSAINTWADFYNLFNEIYAKDLELCFCNSKYIHQNYLIHILMHCFINTRVGKLLFWVTPQLKSLFKKINEKQINFKNEFSPIIEKQDSQRFYGITFILQSNDLNLSCCESQKELIGSAFDSREKIIDDMLICLKKTEELSIKC